MKIALIALLALSQSVFAFETQRVDFRVGSFLNFGGRAYYACDSVEAKTKLMLEKLGATGVSVACRGGIDPFGGFATEAYVDATFDATTTGSAVEVQFRDFSGCHLAGEIFKGIRDSFQISNVRGLRSCMSSSDSYRFNVTVIK